jgi:hypothetical protein
MREAHVTLDRPRPEEDRLCPPMKMVSGVLQSFNRSNNAAHVEMTPYHPRT